MRIFNFILASIFFYIANAQACDQHQLNVVFISLNSLRADHLKTYGYKIDTAPNIAKLAEESFIFEEAIAQSHWTLPSLASMFTSKYVHSLGIYDRTQKIPGKEITLPEVLKIYGYKTAAFVGGLDMSAAYGLNQGFDYYFDYTADKPMGSFSDIMPKAFEWLEKNKNDKFFLFIDNYDIHPPFDKNKSYADRSDFGYSGIIDKLFLDYNLLKNIRNNTLILNGKTVKLTKEDINRIISHYDGGIAWVDNYVGKLLKELDKLDLTNRTIIIITAEHGEELSGHGSFDRFGQNSLYDEVIHVPLIIKFPCSELRGKRIKNQVQLIDIMPTILDFLGIPITSEAQGSTLMSLIKENKARGDFNHYVYSEANLHKWAVRTEDWKLIYDNRRCELYNLKEDRAELNNLATKNPKLTYKLVQILLDWHRKTEVGRDSDINRIKLTEDMKEKLREAGYW